MSKVYLVTYYYPGDVDDLLPLAEVLTEYNWWHYINGSWLVEVTDGSDANTLFEKLRPHLPDTATLLVIEVGTDRQGWLPPKAWDWIKQTIPKRELTLSA